jgi:hypothetical protein
VATLAVMDEFPSGYKRKDRDNEASSSEDNEATANRESICKVK